MGFNWLLLQQFQGLRGQRQKLDQVERQGLMVARFRVAVMVMKRKTLTPLFSIPLPMPLGILSCCCPGATGAWLLGTTVLQ